ncbi:hypothetical protein DMENIID0001_041400 [Sergentomyia squamirostris]
MEELKRGRKKWTPPAACLTVSLLLPLYSTPTDFPTAPNDENMPEEDNVEEHDQSVLSDIDINNHMQPRRKRGGDPRQILEATKLYIAANRNLTEEDAKREDARQEKEMAFLEKIV